MTDHSETLDPIAHLPYRDPAEFIVEWTDRIWVERGVGLVAQNYAEDAVVHSAYGTTVGQAPVIRGTQLRLATFPDRIGQAEDVVWEQRGTDGFLSSHRILSVGTHGGLGSYGAPTHRPFRSRAIANCLYVQGRMVQEWLVRDELTIVRALGLDPEVIARGLAWTAWSDGALGVPPADPLESGDSGRRPDLRRAEAELVLELFGSVWERREFDRISDFVVRDVFCHTVGDRTAIRPSGMVDSLIELFAPFPDATIEIRDVVTNDSSEHGGVRVAVQWLLRGTYDGAPSYGATSSAAPAPVRVLGASQFLVQHGRIATEWRVYDELATMTQIALHRGDQP